MVLLIFYRGDAVDFDVEGAGPVGDIDKDAGGGIGGEEFGVDGINGREVVDGGTVDVAFEDVVEVGAGSFEATLHLLEDELGLAFDGGGGDFAGAGVKGREAGYIDGVTGAGDDGGGGFPSFQPAGDGFDADDFPFHAVRFRSALRWFWNSGAWWVAMLSS